MAAHADLLIILHTAARAGFYLLSGITLIAALGFVLTRNLLHSALWLAGTLLGVAGLYLCLGAEFLTVVQILVYVGAILTLLVFGVMLTARLADPAVPALIRTSWAAAPVALGTGWVLASALAKTSALPRHPTTVVPLAELGQGLVTWYLLPFEVLSLILVAALVGAIVIAKPREGDER